MTLANAHSVAMRRFYLFTEIILKNKLLQMNSIQNVKYIKQNKSSKRIKVFLNGNQYDSYKIVINSRKLRKWHHILNEITQKLNPNFGSVKKLYSSVSGMTLNSFTDLQDNDTYVASDNRNFQFIEGGYNKRKQNTSGYLENVLSEKFDSAHKSKKLACVQQNNIAIYVFNNGKYRESPKKIVLTKDDRFNWENTVSFIALILDMPYRNIKFLYNTKGHAIYGPWELQHGANYVAVGYYEKFIKRNYDNNIKNDTINSWERDNKWTNTQMVNSMKNAIKLNSIPNIGGSCSYYDITNSYFDTTVSNSTIMDETDAEIKKLSEFYSINN